MNQRRSEPDNLLRIGALRSRLVSKLTGLTMRQLQYWHGTELLPAHERRGARGYPRLYSWVDYMKLREASKLLRQGVPTSAIRKAVPILDELAPEWYLLPLQSYRKRHVLADLAEHLSVLARPDRQILLPLETLLRQTLQEMQEEGPLGELHEYEDAVNMDPEVVAGNPVVRETRLETAFIAGLRGRGYSADDIARIYRLPVDRVERAIAFEQALAA